MKQIITESTFIDAFQSIRPDNFSYSGLVALFNYLEDMEQDTGQEIELDVIAICCDFSEYNSIEAVIADYNNIEDEEDLQCHTTVIEFDGGLIIQQF